MNREMVVFGTLTVMLGTVLFAGLQLEPRPERLLTAQSHEMAPADVPPPTSHGPSAVEKERKNPFAPPIEVKPISQPRPVKPPPDQAPPPPPPPPPSEVVKPQPKTITEWSPAEIPVGFAGIFALPGQPAEAHLTAKDGSTMIVHVGDEIKSLGVKIVEIAATDVTVEVGDRRASLRDLIQKNTNAAPAGGNPVPAGGAPAIGNVGDLMKKLIDNGGKLNLGALQNLTPAEQKALLSDPTVKKLIEDQIKNGGQNLPGTNENRRTPGGNNGGGGNRGTRGGRGGNDEGAGRAGGAAPHEAGVDR